jgi:aspartate/methionine/tyrosine aminotransferase
MVFTGLVSPTLAINEEVDRRRAAGLATIPLGFGEAGLPVLPELVDQLVRASSRAQYGPVAGVEEVRHAAAGVATLPGSAFGQGEDVLALRIATSLLYCLDDEQRLSALHHESPASLPWIKGQLDAIAAALQALLHDR